MGDATDDGDDDIPVIADEVLAARIAGLVPDESNGTNTLVNSKVVVSGLVSVASIAGFKRHLARMVGVATVGVSSGPDGEFIFTVSHMSTDGHRGGDHVPPRVRGAGDRPDRRHDRHRGA